jgi:hypothetical protein
MAGSSSNGKPSAGRLAAEALKTVEDFTGFRTEAATGMEWDGELWRVTVDALELSRVPNTTDVIGTYEVRLDDQGELRGYRRLRRYVRGEAREED